MPIVLTDEDRRRIEEFRRKHKTGVLTLVFTDMVGSTDLKRVLGDAGGTALIQQQQNIIRETLSGFAESEEISTAGDSFFITFIRPSDAVRFSLSVHSKLRKISERSPHPVAVRIGIHMGEVFIQTGPQVRQKRDILGIQVDAASRVMELAVGGQTLMTRSVFDNARAVLRGEEIKGLGALQWLNHGYFKAAGVEEPFEVCEVGEEGIAPLSPPASRGKVQRFVVPDLQPVIGWHPALELEVPTARGWVLKEKVGEGGFSEVWRAQHKTLREDRIFKFCFHADRVRSLRREVTLFRLLREQVGDHPNIVRIHDVYFDDPPYYIVMEHVKAKDLARWCEDRGGVGNIPFETRIEIVIQVAEALQAAHEAGVVHRDVKPTNILVGGEGVAPSEVRVRLTDFGIGEVLPDRLAGNPITSGLTEIGFKSDLSSRTGTRVYMAPEILAGRSSTVASDIYSLGVVLYQLVIEDLSQPVTIDWRDRVEDAVIAEDIARCFAGNPESRYQSAEELARNLRSLGQRRLEYEEKIEGERKFREAEARRLEKEREEARRLLYESSIREAGRKIEELRYPEVRELLDRCPPEMRNWEWGRLQYLCHLDRATLAGHTAPVVSLAVSPDGKWIASGSEDRLVIVWDFETGREVFRSPPQSARVDSVCFHPDSERLAVGTGDGVLSLWDFQTAEKLLELQAHSGLIDSLAFSPDGQKIAAGSWDTSARIWKVETGQPLAHFEARSPLRVVFTPDGDCLALGSWDEEGHIWDVETGKQKVVLNGRFPPFGIRVAAFSRDASRLATGETDGTARIWDTEKGTLTVHVKGHREALQSLCFDLEGNRLLTGSGDHTARIWDLDSPTDFREFRGHGGSVTCIASGPDAQQPVTGSSDGTIKCWDLVTSHPYHKLEGHRSGVWQVAFSPDGRRLASCSGDSTWESESDNLVRIWDVSIRETLQRLEEHTSGVLALGFSPEGRRLVTGSSDNLVRVWDLETGDLLYSADHHKGFVVAVAFSPDGSLVASGSRDGTARLWSSSTGKEVHCLDRHSAPVSSLAFDPLGRFLVTGSWDKTAKVWDIDSGREIRTLSGHLDQVECVAVTPNGTVVATGSKDRTIRLWNPETGKENTVRIESDVGILGLAFSPDGSRILAGCGDNTVRLWNRDSGNHLLTLRGHGWFVVSAVFSPEGRMVATGSLDHSIILWPSLPWRREEYETGSPENEEPSIEMYKRAAHREERDRLLPFFSGFSRRSGANENRALQRPA